MGNRDNSKINKIILLAKKLPWFCFDDFAGIEGNKHYLKIIFSRYEKAKKLIRLKKGFYVTKDYFDSIEKKGLGGAYSEAIANFIYQPSYLSSEYILYKANILTEIPNNFTSITKNKTQVLSNLFGNFSYRKIKDDLFCGFIVSKEGDFSVWRATKAKALFDFLYLRKNDLTCEEAVKELRLNLDDFNNKDKKELKKYLKIEGSKKMKEIFNYLF